MKTENSHRFYKMQWQGIRLFAVLWTVLISIKILIDLPEAFQSSGPGKLQELLIYLLLLPAALIIAWLARHWFNLLAGAEICHWRRRP